MVCLLASLVLARGAAAAGSDVVKVAGHSDTYTLKTVLGKVLVYRVSAGGDATAVVTGPGILSLELRAAGKAASATATVEVDAGTDRALIAVPGESADPAVESRDPPFVGMAAGTRVKLGPGAHVVKVRWPLGAGADLLVSFAMAPEPVALAQAEDAASDSEAPPAALRPPFDVAAKLILLIPAGKTEGAAALPDTRAEAGRFPFGSFALAFRYSLPWLDRSFALAAEAGVYRLSGEGKRGFANDPDFGPEVSYAWKTWAWPLLLGGAYRIPAFLPLPLDFTATAGFAAVFVTSESTYTAPATGAQVADAPQEGWALGFYLGAEASLRLGPGSVVGELRYTNARTDLGFQEIYRTVYNAQRGDVEGTNLVVGYRYAF